MNALKKIQYNCNKATYLIEKRMLDKITLREKIELRIHLAGCSVCKVFDQQSRNINQLVRNLFSKQDAKLSDDDKKAIHTLIEKQINHKDDN